MPCAKTGAGQQSERREAAAAPANSRKPTASGPRQPASGARGVRDPSDSAVDAVGDRSAVHVPALRRDGSLVDVSLTITEVTGGPGRTAFRAVLATEPNENATGR